MQKSLFYTRLYNLQSKVQVLISRTRKHLLSKTARTIVCVQDDITSLLIIGFRQNATLLTTITVIRSNFKMGVALTTFRLRFAKESRLNFASFVVSLSVLTCSVPYVVWYTDTRERKESRWELALFSSSCSFFICSTHNVVWYMATRERKESQLKLVLFGPSWLAFICSTPYLVWYMATHERKESCLELVLFSASGWFFICITLNLLWYMATRERKDTWMERIKQTYIPLGPGWRSDCAYVISHSVTDNTQETNTEEPAENVLLVDESSSVHSVPNDDELVKALHKHDNEKRVLFVGGPGIGKSHLFRSIANKWANGKILKDVILIYLQLDHVPRETCILKEFLKLMKRDNSEKEIQSLILELQREKSIVLLDGISSWSRFCNTTSNKANENVTFLTIEELLESDNIKFKEMKVWVTSRNAEADVKVMKGNYTKVNLNRFNEEHKKIFFKKFLEMKKSGEEIRRLSTEKQQQYKSKLIDENKYKSILCDKDVLTRSPVFSWYLATMYCSEANSEDIQSRVETFCKDFPDMVATTKALMESKKIDLDFDLLVCLLEVGGTNDNDYMTCAQMLQLEELVFNHIKDEYFQDAILRLLKTLKETDSEITSLTVYGDCPIKLFSCLPKIEKRLVIYNVPFKEIHFIAVIQALSQRELTLEFHDSEVPETFPVIKLLNNYSTTNLSVFRYKGEENPAKLSWKEGVWTKWTNEEDIHPSIHRDRADSSHP